MYIKSVKLLRILVQTPQHTLSPHLSSISSTRQHATEYLQQQVIYLITSSIIFKKYSGKLGAIVAAQSFVFLSGAFCTGGVCSSSSATADVNSGLQVNIKNYFIFLILRPC
jgi:hypothetical protein